MPYLSGVRVIPLNNLPSSLQDIIQTGFLERKFGDALRAKLGFRAIADVEPFPAGIGETLTKTRAGLLPAIITPIAPAANTDLTSGLTPQIWPTEQYSLSVQQYAADTMLNLATSRVAISSVYVQNAVALAEQAARSVDTLAQRTLMGNYMGGNTVVTVTLGSAGTTVSVNDITGFQTVLNSAGQPVAVSPSNPLTVTINNTGYSVVGATADGTNVSTRPMGVSGTLTTSGNVSTTDGTSGNAVISGVAPAIIRPGNVASSNLINPSTMVPTLTAGMILAAKAQLAANNVPPGDDGMYVGYFDPLQLVGLYNDTMFQNFFRGGNATPEYRKGIVAELLGVRIMETNLNPVQTGATIVGGTATIRRGIVAGKGALIEAQFTRSAYADAMQVSDDPMITVVDGIAHITREPIDALKQVVTQAWSFIGGFTVPTDLTAKPATLPTATNAALKRAVVIESL